MSCCGTTEFDTISQIKFFDAFSSKAPREIKLFTFNLDHKYDDKVTKVETTFVPSLPQSKNHDQTRETRLRDLCKQT